MPLIESSLCSQVLGNERRMWVQPVPDGRSPEALCLLLDGEFYIERVRAPEIIAELQRAPALPPLAVVYVSHVDLATRWPESFCNERFARFIAEEALPWARQHCNLPGRDIPAFLGGLSLTGLAAAHAVLTRPGAFCGVLCQSASFWWSDNWLVRNCPASICHTAPPRMRITCGSREVQDYVVHGPDLVQRTSQLDCNRAMRDVLQQLGYPVSYIEFDGGHTMADWQRDLPQSLTALLTVPG